MIKNAREEMENICHNISYYHATMEEKVDDATTRISHHINIQETKISRYIQQQRQLIQQNIQNDFKTAIHQAIQEYIEPLMENSKLTGDNVLLSIKTMQNDIVQDIK